MLEQIAEQGLGILPELVRIVINTAMQAEREQYLGAAAYERAETRRGHANGYKPKTVTTTRITAAISVCLYGRLCSVRCPTISPTIIDYPTRHNSTLIV